MDVNWLSTFLRRSEAYPELLSVLRMTHRISISLLEYERGYSPIHPGNGTFRGSMLSNRWLR